MYYRLKKKYPEDTYLDIKFIFYRNKTANLVKSTKTKYYSSLIENNYNNLKKTWSVINELIFNKRSSIEEFKLNIGSTTSSDPVRCANVFNNHFVLAAENLTNKLTRTNNFLSYLNNRNLIDTFNIRETNSDEFTNIINNLNKSSAVGYDGISSANVKRYGSELAPVIAKLIIIK